MAAVLIFFPLKWDHYFIFGFLCLIKPDSDRISTLEPFISQKMGYYTVYVSHLGFFLSLHQFETHIIRILEPESPNFDPNYAFLSSIEAEIITVLPKKVAILFFSLLCPSYRYFNVAPLPELIVRPQRPLIPKMVLLSAL